MKFSKLSFVMSPSKLLRPSSNCKTRYHCIRAPPCTIPPPPIARTHPVVTVPPPNQVTACSCQPGTEVFANPPAATRPLSPQRRSAVANSERSRSPRTAAGAGRSSRAVTAALPTAPDSKGHRVLRESASPGSGAVSVSVSDSSASLIRALRHRCWSLFTWDSARAPGRARTAAPRHSTLPVLDGDPAAAGAQDQQKS